LALANQQFTIGRAAFLVALASIAAFLLLRMWAWSAAFPWSSDPWVMAIPVAIIFAGLISLVGLVIVFMIRLVRRKK
jgi:predicted lysophospholipase L1 biosynthesis ABC-type transport system permease subunit